MKPFYAFDIDGVLADTREIHRLALQERLGVTLHDGGTYATFGFEHDSDEVMVQLEAVGLEVWREVAGRAYPSGVDVVTGLFERGRLMGYVTRRDPGMYGVTRQWLEQSGYPYAWDMLAFAAQGHERHKAFYRAQGVPSACKSAAIMHWLRAWRGGPELSRVTLVEDSPHEAAQAHASGLSVTVIRRPYNRAFERQCVDAGVDIQFINHLEELP